MDFRILGPLQVLDDGRDVAPAGSKRRALLALMLLHANETLSTERLIDELWGDDPPRTAAKALHAHVSRLRKALGAASGAEGPIVTREHGYELRLDPEQLDAYRFERLVAEGGRDLAAGRPARAAAAFESALALWSGAALAGLGSEPFVQREAARLEDLRLAAIEQLIDAKLALGLHVELVGQLEALIGDHPYRERLRAQLMLALYRSDRQADALQAYQDARRTLVEELGIEPGQRLRELERAILAQDPELAVAPVERKPGASRLPAPPNRTLGRDHDREAVASLLRRPDTRLVTLTGPGGVGKTRLALEVARALEPGLPDGGWFVSLASTANAEHVPSAIAQGLGVTPRDGETAEQALERFLVAKDGVLVVDNFEHVLPAAPLIAELLAAAPALVVLATSREALCLQAEHVHPVAPLRVPAQTAPAAVAESAAGALFAARARSRDATFELTEANAPAVAGICKRLDGLPLAIELAAARVTVLGVEELNDRLSRALDVLGRGSRDAPSRQRTLRLTIEWSHRLLSAEEAEAFAAFAVFAGGATLEAAQEVTGADLDVLESLLDKHLLHRVPGTAPARLTMLETVRQYALEQLDAGGRAPEVRRRHCEHYVALAERMEPRLLTQQEGDATPALDVELNNLRAAFDWSLHGGDPGLALRLAGLTREYWEIRGMMDEGLSRTDAALRAAGAGAPVADRARASRARADLLIDNGVAYASPAALEEARAHAAEAVELSRRAGDPAGIAEALLILGDMDAAESLPQRRRRALAEEALTYARQAGDERLTAMAMRDAALALPVDEALPELERAAAALRRVGGLRRLLGLYTSAAYNALKLGKPELAGPLLDEVFPIVQELDDPLAMVGPWGNIGLTALFEGDLERARAAFESQLRLCAENRITWLIPESLGGLAAIAAAGGEAELAAWLLGAAAPYGSVGDADVEALLHERFFAPARARVGEEAWRGAEAAGAALSLDKAVGMALAAPAQPPPAKSASSSRISRT